jgi:SAM-dependent methyltransferase
MLIDPSQPEMDVRAKHEANRAGWNEGALHYTATLDEAIAFLRAGKSNLHPVERRNLGDLRQYPTAIHLQCASGKDTLSLWNEGVARVIGVDISDRHIENARKMSAALQAPAEWYRCDVLEVPHELDGVADLVYTGRGALCWLHDLTGYAQVVARLLKPGGVYHVFDDHPATWLFDPDSQTYIYSGVNYFDYSESNVGWPSTYIGDTLGIPPEQQSRKYEHLWSLSDIFTALTSAGLVVEIFGEHPEPYWDSFPNLKEELRGKIPLTFSMLARKRL